MFWGKVTGTIKDYFLALAIDQKEIEGFPQTSFYWCSSGNYNFAQLPNVNEESAQFIEGINSLFTGEYDKILKESSEPAQELALDDDAIPLVIKGKDITELDRLSCVVHSIERACHIIPEGVGKLTPLKEIRTNEAFRGLKKEDAINLSKYYHFREIEGQEKKERVARDDSIFKHDFLDSIADDPTKGRWSLQLDATGATVNIRNLLWPGYFHFHKIGTKLFGSVYMGDGRKQKDLPFML